MSLLVAGAAALLAGGVALGLQGLGSDSSPLPVQRVESEISAGLGSDIPSLRPVRPEITAGLTAPASAEIPDAFVRAVNAHTR